MAEVSMIAYTVVFGAAVTMNAMNEKTPCAAVVFVNPEMTVVVGSCGRISAVLELSIMTTF
jgi:hypothetical protein